MPGFVERAVDRRRAALVRGGAMARIGVPRQRRRQAALEDDRSHGRPSVRSVAGAVLVGRDAVQLDVRAGSESAVSRYGSPSPTSRISRGPVGRDDGPGPVVERELVRRAGRRPGRRRRAGPRRPRRRAGTSSIDDVGPRLRVEQQRRGPRAGGRRPTARCRRCAVSRSRLATLTNDRAGDRRRRGPHGERDDRLVLARRGPTGRTLTGASSLVRRRRRERGVGRDEDLGVAGRGPRASTASSQRVAEVAGRRRWPRCRRAPAGRAPGRSSR